MKKLIFSLFILVALATPSAISAETNEKEVICSQSYGQPVVCGVKTPEDEPIIVDTGLLDDPRMLGMAFMAIAGGAYFISNRLTVKSSLHA